MWVCGVYVSRKRNEYYRRLIKTAFCASAKAPCTTERLLLCVEDDALDRHANEVLKVCVCQAVVIVVVIRDVRSSGHSGRGRIRIDAQFSSGTFPLVSFVSRVFGQARGPILFIFLWSTMLVAFWKYRTIVFLWPIRSGSVGWYIVDVNASVVTSAVSKRVRISPAIEIIPPDSALELIETSRRADEGASYEFASVNAA